MAPEPSGPLLSPFSIALALLPPSHIAQVVDTLRSANDKSWPRWGTHMTLLFPFWTTKNLAEIIQTLQETLASPSINPFHIRLDKVARFKMKEYETIYLGSSAPVPEAQALYDAVLAAFPPTEDPRGGDKGKRAPRRNYVPHVTLGQTPRTHSAIALLTEKGNKLLRRWSFEWPVDSVALLVKQEDSGVMQPHAHIPLGGYSRLCTVAYPTGICSGTPTYHFNEEMGSWEPTVPHPTASTTIPTFSLATYNILHDPASFPFLARLPLILSTLLEQDADILCLQEVSDDALALLVADPRMRRRWPWCSRDGDRNVMESERNIVLFARESCAFEWVRLDLGGKRKHKACCVARLAGTDVVVVGVHLSAGRAEPMLEMKREEMQILLAHLRAHHAANEWVVIGDVNWPSSSGEAFPGGDELVDVWNGDEDDDCATYDPTRNALAAATARDSRTPERYDRVFVRRGGRLVPIPEKMSLFGMPSEGQAAGSDHWGLRVVLRDRECRAEPKMASEKVTFAPHVLSSLSTSLTDDELTELCAEKGRLPSEQQDATFREAVQTLRNFLASLATSLSSAHDGGEAPTSLSSTPIRLILAPVGSFAMGYHSPQSDIDCVVVGNVNPPTFWTLVRRRIRHDKGRGAVKLRRFVKDALVQMMELEVDGIKMDLQYCPAAKLVACWDELFDLPRDSPLFSLPASSLRTLNAHRDAMVLINALPSPNAFRLAHRALKLFLTQHGIVGARFGFLGGFHLAFMLARISLILPSAGAAQLVRVFLHVYARWDWQADMVSVPIPGLEGPSSYRRSHREPMVVLSVEKPQVNMTVNANPSSLQVIRDVFVAGDRACERGSSWREICEIADDGTPPHMPFVRAHRAFVKVEVCYWGSSCMKGRCLVGWLESRFVRLLVALHSSVPAVLARLWPERLADGDSVDDGTLHGFYLIGLSLPTMVSKSSDRENIKSAISAVLHEFEREVQGHERYYDPAEMFVSVTSVSCAQLPSRLILDGHRWSDGGFDNEEDEEEEEDPENALEEPDTAAREDIQGGLLSAASGDSSKGRQTKPKTKLRTSFDVYNRLMWDPAVAKEDYVIGYEDRFKGVKETPLTAWKREVEDEAFIPFHRVVHFRRKSDNVVVWDRKMRKDLVFGSGGVAE